MTSTRDAHRHRICATGPIVLTLLLCLAPRLAHAQTCRGVVPLDSSHPGIVEIPLTINNGVTSIGLGVGGGNNKWFGGGFALINNESDADIRTWTVGTVFGSQVAAKPDRKLVICPIGSISYERANNIAGSGVNGWNLTTSGGVTVGVDVYRTDTVGVVPFAGFALQTDQVHLSDGIDSGSLSDTYGVIRIGLGLLMGRSSITPAVLIPVGLDDSSAAFAIVYAMNFGGK